MMRSPRRRVRIAVVLGTVSFFVGLCAYVWVIPALESALSSPIYDRSRFRLITLRAPEVVNPTTLQFGRDGALYVGMRSGLIGRLTIVEEGGALQVRAAEQIRAVQEIPNHDDSGNPLPELRERLVTGIAAAGTAADPVLFVSSSDPRIDHDGIDTNSGVISRLVRKGRVWTRTDLVRGLPRSRYDHAPHGIAIDETRSVLYVSIGGNTNLGAPSQPFRMLSEYPLSGAILSIDLAAIGGKTYDLPTLDDPTRAGAVDTNDPFGGNSGRNAAVAVPDSPVQIHAEGLRNAYDLALTPAGIFTIDNGANTGFGGPPGAHGAARSAEVEGGGGTLDALYFVRRAGLFLGHPNPARRRSTGPKEAPLQQFRASTNGLAVYAPESGRWERRLLAVSLDGTLSLLELDAASVGVERRSVLLANLPGMPLDVWSQNRSEPLPGSIWIADFGDSAVHVLVPAVGSAGAPLATVREMSRVALAKLLLRGIALRHDLLDTLRALRLGVSGP